jgi:Uma2 family endonuclease
MVQTPPKAALTLDKLLKLPETKPASEFIDGKVVQKLMPQGSHSIIQGESITTIRPVGK